MLSQLKIESSINKDFYNLIHISSTSDYLHKKFSNLIRYSIKPLSYRKWSKEKNCWSIHKSKLPITVFIARKYYQHIDYSSLSEELQIFIVQETKERSSGVVKEEKLKVENPYTKLHLLESAPIEVVKASYKALVLLYHSDRGGDEEVLKEINLAYTEIINKN